MPTDIKEEGLELPPPPKKKRKVGRPPGRKNNRTLKKERRQKALDTAKDLLAQGSVKKGGKKLIDVAAILHKLDFNPLYEAVELFREIDEDTEDPDRRKLLIDIIKFITAFYVAKPKTPENSATSNNVPIFNIQIGAANYRQPAIDVTPRDSPDVIDADAEEDEDS